MARKIILRKMSKFELGWVAGILEGEGCFSGRVSGKDRIYLSIEVQTADRDVCERLIEYTGLGKVGGPYKPEQLTIHRCLVGSSPTIHPKP